MTDTFSKDKRSQIMRAVKSSGNQSTELQMISWFRELGIRGWRRNYPLFGKPDFVFRERRTVVFIDGCFWHGHDCRNTRPKQNQEYWEAKRNRNIARDRLVKETLKKKGWQVIRIWECEVKNGSPKFQRKLIPIQDKASP